MAAISENIDDKTALTSSKITGISDWSSIINQLPNYGLTISFLGVRASGKTHAAQDFVYQLSTKGNRRYTASFLFSATAKTQHGSYPYIPSTHKFTSLAPLSQVLAMQNKLVQHNRELEKEEGGSKHFIRSAVLIIIDDFSAMSRDTKRDDAFTSLYTHGRHLRHEKSDSFMDIVTLGQDITQLSPIQRANCDLIASAQTLSYRATKLMAEDYLTVGVDRKSAYALLHSLSSTPYLFLVVWVTHQPKTTLSSYCFYMLAPKELPQFRIGSKQQWKHDDTVET